MAKREKKMCAEVLFRSKERKDIQEAIIGDTGNIVEVYGPPMVGKSSLIKQVVHNIQSLDQSPDEHTIYHKFWCKNIYVLQDLFIEIVQVLSPNQLPAATSKEFQAFYDINFILELIQNIVTRSDGHRHIFVFHKCESFHINGKSFAFLSFLGEMVNMFQSIQSKVHVVFSTYKRFSLIGHKATQVNVGMLTNPCDIIYLLSHYAPGVYIIDYVYICQRYLCLPKPIVQLAISYISKNIFTPKFLEHFLCKDLRFYSEMFDTRQYEVCSWLTKYELDLIDVICRTGSSPFSKGHVESLSVQAERGDTAYKSLKENLVIEDIDHSDELLVHPLVLHKCALVRTVRVQDNLCKTNSYTQFIGQSLMKAETNTEKHGMKGQTYGCHRLDWPDIRQLFQRAICGDFKDILRVAVIARRLIMVLYPNEAKQFYAGLFETTQAYGSPREAAVMEACLGHITASGSGINFQSALRHLDSALETLKYRGPTFFYKWALRRKAIILFRMSRYPQSTKYFQKAKAITDCVPMSLSDHEVLSVSSLQIEEDDIIGDIYEAIPMIFTGDNENALKKLLLVNETIHDRYENHPDLDVLTNNIGLALERGNGDLKGALVWYTKSLKHRSLLIRINPQPMLVTLNNVAMIKIRIGDLVGAERDLQKAITIIREGIWYHNNTVLTLTSLATIKVKLREFQEAYDYLLSADEILQKIFKTNDYRLLINLRLFHYKSLSNHKDDRVSRTDSMSNDIERLVDLGFSINKHMSDSGHQQLISVYLHGMVVDWGVSEDKVKAHKEMLLRHVENNDLVKDMLEKKILSAKHKQCLDYVINTEFDRLELDKLLDYLNLTCPTCRLLNEILGKKMWLKDRLAPSRQLNVIKVEHQLMDTFSSFSDISSKTSFPLEDLRFFEEKQNALNKHPYFLKQKNNSELVYLYHSGRDFPSQNTRQRIPHNEDIVNTIGLTLSGSRIMNPSTVDSLVGQTFPSTRSFTTCAIVNPSISLPSTASQIERLAFVNQSIPFSHFSTISPTPCKQGVLNPSSLYFCLCEQYVLNLPSGYVCPREQDILNPSSGYNCPREQGILNPSSEYNCPREQGILNPSSGYSCRREQYVLNLPSGYHCPRELSILNPSSGYNCPRELSILNPSSGYNCPREQGILNPSSGYNCSREQYFLNLPSEYNCPREQYVINPPSEYNCPREQYVLNLHSEYNCPREQYVLNPPSEYNCPSDQDILNPSIGYYCRSDRDILNPSSGYYCPCEQGIPAHSGGSSFEFLFGLPELADWNDLDRNVIALYSLSSPLSYLDYPPLAVHSPTHCSHFADYFWVGSHLFSEVSDYQSFPINLVCDLGSGGSEVLASAQ